MCNFIRVHHLQQVILKRLVFVGSLSCTARESAELQQHFQPPEYNYPFHNSYTPAQSNVGKSLNKQRDANL